MPAELTAEEIVTNLLLSQEILKQKTENFSVTNFLDLNGYLKNLPQEEMNKSEAPLLTTLPTEEGDFKSKYTFIKEGGWKI